MKDNKTVEEVVENAEEVVEEEQTQEVEDVQEVVEDQSDEYLQKYQRLFAEFDNFRKRSEKEKQNTYDFATSKAFTAMLSVVDNFERALKQECDDKDFYQGVEMIYKQLVDTLEKQDVTPIEAEGKTFDPEFHNAIFHVEDESVGENVVVEELQKGYLYKDKVLRHSMVKVAN